jgi:uncharacterized membrane protein HdeD (DUF308 family)
MPEVLNNILGIIVGIGILLVGLINIYNYLQNKNGTNVNFLSGILYSVLGAIIIIYPNSIMNLSAKCLGVYLMISGIVKLKMAINLKNVASLWTGTLIASILIFALGVLLLINPFAGLSVTRLAGFFIVATAIIDIIDTYYLQKK